MVKKILNNSYLVLILLLLYTPILFVMVFSFTQSKVMGSWQGFSLQVYKDLFTGKEAPRLFNAFTNTLLIGVAAAAISTILGTMGAIGIYYSRKRAKRILSLTNDIPILNADIIMGVSLLLFFVIFMIPRGWFTVLLAHISFCAPYVVLSVLPKLKQMNNNVYEAALDLGATPIKALFKTVIPEILPGMISGFLLSFTLSIDDFVITNYTAGETFENLSLFVYSHATKNDPNVTIRALSTLIFAVVLGVLLIVNLRSNKNKIKEKKR